MTAVDAATDSSKSHRFRTYSLPERSSASKTDHSPPARPPAAPDPAMPLRGEYRSGVTEGGGDVGKHPSYAPGCNENLHCQASGFTQCGGMLRCAMATALSAHSAAIWARTCVVALPTCGNSTTLGRSASPGLSLGSCS
jgi:hypothetical protein